MKTLILSLFVVFFVYDAARAQDDAPPPPFNMPPEAAWSVFTENFRNGFYAEALPYGRWLVTYRPTTLEGFEDRYRGHVNFNRMIRVYGHMIESADDPDDRAAYADSALALYDRALSIFTEDQIDFFRWKFDRGRFIQSNARHIENGRQLAIDDYATIYSMDPERTVGLSDGYYILTLVNHHVSEGERDEAISLMNHAEQYADPSVIDQFNSIRNSLFRNPEERLEFVKSQLEDDPDNLELLTEVFELYERIGDRDKVIEYTEILYNKNPNFESIMRMADLKERDARYAAANRYLREALDHANSDRAKAELNIRIADNLVQQDNLREARTHAQRAARLNPSWGVPLITMAEIYARAVTQCTEGGALDRNDKVVYWLVLDYLSRARSTDSSVANRVQRLRASYEPVTPTSEEKFYSNWENGDTIRVDGSLKSCYDWIAESTTVR